MNIFMRWLTVRDLKEVLDIERRAFGSHAWNRADFEFKFKSPRVIGMVAEDEKGGVRGYTVYELREHSIDVQNFAVDPLFHRQGIGTQIVDRLKEKISPRGRRRRLTLSIRETNVAAQLFFQRMGFTATTILRDLYEDTNEDAYLFWYRARAEVEASVVG